MEPKLPYPPPVVTRAVRLPDPLRLARCLRAPELGPQVLFFSGGTALRALSRRLKHYTHNSVHLITPFDSGGSSAQLRAAFDMPSVGDLRNRLMALADESIQGSPEIYRLFSHRLGSADPPQALQHALTTLIDGVHPLVIAVPEPMRRIIRTHLRDFARSMPEGFDLRGASIGNLILAGGYLANERDLESVIYTFSRLIEARGQVRPVCSEALQLAVRLKDGQYIVGQHLLTGKESAPITQPVTELTLVRSLSDPRPVQPVLSARNRELIQRAELLCYPMGSFFSSVAANLLPRGVGCAIAAARCPKVYIPNTGRDPEQLGYDTLRCLELLVRLVRRDAGADTPVQQVVDTVLIDRRAHYEHPIDEPALLRLGLQVIDTELAGESSSKLDPQRLANTLIALA